MACAPACLSCLCHGLIHSEYVTGNPDSLASYTCKLLTPAQQQQLTALN